MRPQRWLDEDRSGFLNAGVMIFFLACQKNLKSVIEQAEAWPDWAKDELAQFAMEMDRELKGGTYRATRDELRKLDEAVAAVERGRSCDR